MLQEDFSGHIIGAAIAVFLVLISIYFIFDTSVVSVLIYLFNFLCTYWAHIIVIICFFNGISFVIACPYNNYFYMGVWMLITSGIILVAIYYK